jgi:hypothetical protein
MIWDKILKAFEPLVAAYQSKVKEETQEMASQVYKDSELKISEKAVGGKAEVVNTDGTLSVCPDGEYELEDGSKFKVKDGLISEWNGENSANKKEEVKAGDQPAGDNKPDQVAELKTALESLKAETDSIKQAVEEIKAMCANYAKADDAANFTKQLDEINATLKIIANTPAEFSKTSTNNVIKDSRDSKMSDLLKVYANLKSN